MSPADRIAELVAAAPPLSAEQRIRLAVLLRPGLEGKTSTTAEPEGDWA